MDDMCTLRTVLECNMEYHSDKIALVEGGRHHPFREFADRTSAMGNALLNMGLEKSDRVAIMGHNSMENAESYFNIPNAGLVLVMLNFRLAPKEVLTVLQDSGISVLMVNKAYMAHVEETRKDCKNGADYSQDLCRVDDQGFIYVVDRKKDMIITGGENVYPAEVENVLYRHPGVAMAAVIATPDEKWGEAVTALVVKKGRRAA